MSERVREREERKKCGGRLTKKAGGRAGQGRAATLLPCNESSRTTDRPTSRKNARVPSICKHWRQRALYELCILLKRTCLWRHFFCKLLCKNILAPGNLQQCLQLHYHGESAGGVFRFIRVVICGGRDSSVGITTLYGLEGPGIESKWRRDLYSRPDRS